MTKAMVVLLLLAAAAIGTAAQTVQYFPNLVFSDNQQENNSFEKGYTELLKAIREPSLLEQSKTYPNARAYRLLLSQALAIQSPILVRLNVNDDGAGLLTVKIMGRVDGRVIELKQRTRRLSRQKTKRFLDQVQSLDYSNLPTRDPRNAGLDGAYWMIECVVNGSYKLLNRWSPEKGPVREIGSLLIDLAGLKVVR